jgi:hypothetical protein
MRLQGDDVRVCRQSRLTIANVYRTGADDYEHRQDADGHP